MSTLAWMFLTLVAAGSIGLAALAAMRDRVLATQSRERDVSRLNR